MSLGSIVIPFFFYILEIGKDINIYMLEMPSSQVSAFVSGLTVASAILHFLQFFAPPAYPFPLTNIFNVVDGTLGAVTAVTSVLATLMIGYRIYSVTKANGRFTNKYKRIVDILVQSSLMYSLSIIAFDVCVFLASSTQYYSPYVMVVTEYIASFSEMITVCVISLRCVNNLLLTLYTSKGLAPTLMVGRLAILCGEQGEHTDALTSWRTTVISPQPPAPYLEIIVDIENASSCTDRMSDRKWVEW